ncbi:hypothetical protein PF002_g15915 [Phytophthora fragariae]|nr:hypothetical protein PF009_g14874 [Phytophthora fragariae]KAE9012751.1 hypothetical protein PF011_g8779 [Phytophthora fragariae]KAE9104813.1 hypothetical protein PF007_g13924 [Phytophthora fragariae]KAE9141905.1 hypothetical protein PF006_g12945 [Phytophthora fragariae]KAE9220362.1 hypothetical protein PF002_g15915 [Phytophthora fragariae]
MSNNFDDYDTGDPHRRHHGRAGCKCSGGVKDNDYGDYWRFGDVAYGSSSGYTSPTSK